jgi:tetratricopeptide (TPR) repeat protein
LTTATERAAEAQTQQPRSARPLRQLCRLLLVAAGIGVLAGVVIRVESGLEVASAAIQDKDFAEARAAIVRYLWLHPRSTAARLVAADSYALDDSLPAEEAARNAIEHLRTIPDSDPAAAVARMREGRLTFLILQQPARADKLFLRAIELDPNQFDSHYLRWKLLDMTERYFYSEPEFWEAYRLAPPDQKAFRMRELYLTQFSPLSGCGELDGLMGFRAAGEVTSEAVVYRRLNRFVQLDPAAPEIVAAFAQWHLRNREREIGLELLDGIADPAAALSEPFYVANLTEVLIELGQLERAEAVFEKWPQPARGYHYWRIAGMIHQEVRQQFAAAEEFYRLALTEWPGPSDRLTMYRRSRCLAILGRTAEAEQALADSNRVEKLMELDLHRRLKEVLTHLDRPAGLREVEQFYRDLQCPREAGEWRKIISELEQHRRPVNNGGLNRP